MKFTPEMDLMLRPELLAPQGIAALWGMEHLSLAQVAKESAEKASGKFRANQIMALETFKLQQQQIALLHNKQNK